MTPAPVAVTCWGELPAERRMPGVLRVLVAGQHAGAVERVGDAWAAYWYTAGSHDRHTEHASAQEAVQAVIRSGFARRLGARAASPVHWSERARRAARAPKVFPRTQKPAPSGRRPSSSAPAGPEGGDSGGIRGR